MGDDRLSDMSWDELRSLQSQVNQAIQKKALERLQESLSKTFEKYPQIDSVGFTMHTPYYNDGEPCRFGVSADPEFLIIDQEGTYGDVVYDLLPRLDIVYHEGEWVWTYTRDLDGKSYWQTPVKDRADWLERHRLTDEIRKEVRGLKQEWPLAAHDFSSLIYSLVDHDYNGFRWLLGFNQSDSQITFYRDGSSIIEDFGSHD